MFNAIIYYSIHIFKGHKEKGGKGSAGDGGGGECLLTLPHSKCTTAILSCFYCAVLKVRKSLGINLEKKALFALLFCSMKYGSGNTVLYVCR